MVVKKQRNATLAERHHDLVGHTDAYLRHVTQTASMLSDVEHHFKSNLRKLKLIVLNSSVKWELTARPIMNTANVAMSHLVVDPR